MATARMAPLPPLDRSLTHSKLLFRAVGLASDPRSLILAALGVVAMEAGWSALTSVLAEPNWTKLLPAGQESLRNSIQGPGTLTFARLRPVFNLLQPFTLFFRPDISAGERVYLGLCAVWTLMVWSLFGGAIARITVVRVAVGSRVSILAALKFSLARMGTLVSAPLVPIAVACLIAAAGAAVGLFNRFVPALATAFAFIPLIVGLLTAVILLELAAAWPLMVATVAADGEDFFDAISRSFSYVNQQTIRFVGYLAVAIGLGGLGILVVTLFAMTAIQLADWSISLGAPSHVGFRFGVPNGVGASDLNRVARFWNDLIQTLLNGWSSSYLWSTTAIIYLILRRDVDGKEIHDIYQPSPKVGKAGPIDTGPDEVGPAKAG